MSSFARQFHLASGGLVEQIQALSSVFDVGGDPSLLLLNERKRIGVGHVAMAGGGIITEPVSGIGHRTGRSYSFGERGPETVTPGTRVPQVNLNNPTFYSYDPSDIVREERKQLRDAMAVYGL